MTVVLCALLFVLGLWISAYGLERGSDALEHTYDGGIREWANFGCWLVLNISGAGIAAGSLTWLIQIGRL